MMMTIPSFSELTNIMDDDDEDLALLYGKGKPLTTFQKKEVASKLHDMYAGHPQFVRVWIFARFLSTQTFVCSRSVCRLHPLSLSLSPPAECARISTSKGARLQAQIDAQLAVAETEQARKRQYGFSQFCLLDQ